MSCYAVVDLEMCRVPKGEKRDYFGSASELIQIGAVLLDEKYEITDTFMTYVRPEFGFIDSYIEKLTGISEKDVSQAPDSASALSRFAEWLPDDAVPVSWSDNDLIQIFSEIDGKNLDIPRLEDFAEKWTDCQITFSEKMDTNRSYRLSEALVIADVDYEGEAHDALVDARNTALLFRKMETEPVLKLTPYLVTGYSGSSGFMPGYVRG